MKKIDPSIMDGIKWIEVCIGGDHGKNSYLFIAILLFRYYDKNKETFRLELKLGEINEVKDRIEHVQQLLIKLSHGFNNMKIDNNGDAHVTLDEFNNATFSSGNDNNQSLATNTLFLLKFYLIGDIKGVFQILGRNGYDSS